ncbi:MAG: hypothetical protein AAGI63_07980 [Planctomycetota bacterium]
MKIDNNPYAPPGSVMKMTNTDRSPIRRFIFEVVHALLTIVWILVSWGVIAIGSNDSYPRMIIGFLLMVGACCFGVMFPVRRLSRSERSRGNG